MNCRLTYIPIDSIFSPIKNVNLPLKIRRVGQRTDYEKLILEIATDGSIKPEEAVLIILQGY